MKDDLKSSMVGASEQEHHDAIVTAEILQLVGGSQPDTPSIEEEVQHAVRESRIQMLGSRHEAAFGALSDAVKTRNGVKQFLSCKKSYLWLKIHLAIVFGISCEGFFWANGARLALDMTQHIATALIFVGVFPAMAFGLEAYAHRLSTKRAYLECFLGYVFVASLVLFLWEFAQEFAFVPGVNEIEELLGGFDYRKMFLAQSFLEITITFGLISKFRGWIEHLREPVVNPMWRLLCEEIEQIYTSLQSYEGQIGGLKAESTAFLENRARVRARQRKLHRFLQS